MVICGMHVHVGIEDRDRHVGGVAEPLQQSPQGGEVYEVRQSVAWHPRHLVFRRDQKAGGAVLHLRVPCAAVLGRRADA